MMVTILLLAIALQPAAAPLGKATVFEMLRAGRSQGEVAAEVRKRGVDFRPGTQDETELAAAGAGSGLLEAIRGQYRPAGPPLSLADLTLLLRLRAPGQNVELLLHTRGVNFAATSQIASEIVAAGGDNALVGIAALNHRAVAPPEPPDDPATRGNLALQRAAGPAPEGGGICELRVRVDDIAELLLRGERLRYEVKRGGPPADAGSTCTEALPQAAVSLTVTKLRGRGSVRLIESPSPSNNHTARLLVQDEAGGPDLYHIRISWTR